MFCTASQAIVARRPHNCTWCGQLIAKGETHLMWKSVDDSWMTNRMHPECHAACNDECRYYGEYEYIPYDNERPSGASDAK